MSRSQELSQGSVPGRHVSAERYGSNASIAIVIIIKILNNKVTTVMFFGTGVFHRGVFPKARINIYISYCMETESFQKSKLSEFI
jgi:hypothetical protein